MEKEEKTNEKEGEAWLWRSLDDFLMKKNLKQTKQRQRVIERFLELKGHISAEELHDHIRKKGDNIGLATVYRTLNLLKEAGLADQKQFSDGRSVFEVHAPGSHHDHLICLGCHMVVEFENEAIETLQEEVAKSFNFTLINHSLDLFGYCETCTKTRDS